MPSTFWSSSLGRETITCLSASSCLSPSFLIPVSYDLNRKLGLLLVAKRVIQVVVM